MSPLTVGAIVDVVLDDRVQSNEMNFFHELYLLEVRVRVDRWRVESDIKKRELRKRKK
jgi:hypothetical protein